MAFDTFIPILVVDDCDAAIRTLLRQLGFVKVDDANNAAEAFTKMRVTRYELVISNWHMEPITGGDLLRQVRDDPGLKGTPFIMIGESKSENVIAAKRAGVSSYIVKPVNAQTLKAKIEAVLATRTAPLPERRQAVATSKPPNFSEASVATPDRLKFGGIFTSTLK